MAFTRKMLKAYGIEDNIVEQIMDAHVEVVDALKEERDGYKADAEKLPTVQAELDKLKTTGGNWQEKYEKEHADFEAYKADIDTKSARAAVDSAYRQALSDAGVSANRIDSIMKVTDLTDIKLGADGKLEGADTIAKNIKTEWADFIGTTVTTGVKTANPPANTGNTGGGAMTKAEIMKIKDTTQRQAALAELIKTQKGN